MHKLLSPIAVAFIAAGIVSVVYSQAPPQQPGAAPGQPAAGAGQPGAEAALPGAPGATPGSNPQQQQMVSYALGRQFAMNLKQAEIPIDLNALMAGLSDAIRGAQPKWTDQQLGQVMESFSQDMERKGMARYEQMAAANQKAEADFLAKNKTQPGVQTTASGLQYKVVQQGSGPSPTLKDTVRCNYRGQLLDGTEFDSSARHGGPAEFPVQGVIPGWTEALQKMKVGDKWQLFVPSTLAYDMDPPPRTPIEPGSMLVFEIELLGIAPQ